MLEIRDLHKRFDDADVLRGVSLTIETGEFVTLLGPSGCGKTTTLRIVAGLTAPDAGSVLLDGADITALPPEKRDVNTVFQSYALFPHMNVDKNIAYGLRLRGVKKDERARRVREMLRLVALEGFEERMPSQLSGGQRQRIAIARALVLQPKLLLLDEPLGALDLKLRQQMQRELKDIQKRSGIAFLYVTHDQEEALNLSDRIAIMRDGLIEQIGAPEDIYERPQTRFAAEFIGQSNFLPCEVAEVGERRARAHLRWTSASPAARAIPNCARAIRWRSVCASSACASRAGPSAPALCRRCSNPATTRAAPSAKRRCCRTGRRCSPSSRPRARNGWRRARTYTYAGIANEAALVR